MQQEKKLFRGLSKKWLNMPGSSSRMIAKKQKCWLTLLLFLH